MDHVSRFGLVFWVSALAFIAIAMIRDHQVDAIGGIVCGAMWLVGAFLFVIGKSR